MATKITSRVLADDAVVRATLGDDAIGSAEIADDAIISALVADDIALGGNPTTTTQSTSNSSTRIATTAFVQAAVDADINALIDSAPGTMNTLDEIAAALNDDPTFTTTVNNAIALKAPIASPTFTGNLTGAGPWSLTHGSTPYLDLKVGSTMKGRFYADANQAIIEAVGNSLILKSASTTALTFNSSQDATFAGNIAADTFSTLKGNGSNFDICQNTSDGSDNQRTRIGGGGDVAQSRGAFIELHGNEHSTPADLILNAGDVAGGDIILKTDNTARIFVDRDGYVGIGTTDPSSYNSYGDNLVVATSAHTGISIVAGTTSQSTVMFADGTGGTAGYRGRVGYDHNADTMVLHTAAAERLRIDSAGKVGIGTSANAGTASGDGLLQVLGGSGGSGNFEAITIQHHNTTTTNDGPSIAFEGRYNSNDWNFGRIKTYNNGAGFGANMDFDVHPADGNQNPTLVTAMTIRGDGSSAAKIGIGETVPLAKLHIKEGDSGQGSINSNFDQLLLEDDSHSGMTILSGTSADGAIYFGDSGGNNMGQFKYKHGTDAFEFTTANGAAGVTIRQIVSGGSKRAIGINTTTPDYVLDIDASGDNALRILNSTNSRDVYALFQNTGTGTGDDCTLNLQTAHGAGDPKIRLQVSGYEHWDLEVDNSDNDSFKIMQQNDVRMRFAGGNAQIGSVTDSYTFAQKLVVGDGDANDGITIQSGSTHQGNLAFNDGGTTAKGRISYQHGTNYMQFFVNNAEKMRINNSGYVGMGQAADPAYNLVVASTGNSVLQIKAGDTSWSSLYFGEQSNAYRGIIQYNHNSDYMALYTTGAEEMRIHTGGEVSIGNTATIGSSAKTYLAIGDGSGSATFTIYTGTNQYGYFNFADGTSGAGADPGYMRYNHNNDDFYFNRNVSGPSFSSDLAMKENVADITDGWAVIKDLRPRTFDWKKDELKNDYLHGMGQNAAGFIAQEVETVLPNEVHGEEGGKGLSPTGIVAYLVKTVQELEARIKTLEG